MSAPRGSLLEFLEDIEPFFYRRSLLYVDVGAYKGEVFKKLLASRLKIREAHLIEPNPNSVEVLRRNIEGLFKGHILTVHPLAAGATKGTVRLRLAESMSKVVCPEDPAAADEAPESGLLTVECRTLDELSLLFSERHISLLKIDVEGYEDQVLAGASALLSEQEVDVIYVEAGMNPAGTQQCYFRKLDDILLAHGYRLFRIYEQKHEWLEDSPFLRRANLAFLSPRFAEQSPYLLARELFDAQMQLQSLQAQHDELTKRARALADAESEHTKALSAEQQRYRALDADRSEMKERLQALRRERTELTGRIVEIETTARVDALTREELKQRLAMMTDRHQTQIIQLSEGRQVQRDLERQLARCADELGETERSLQEVERSRSALSLERDELNQKLEASMRANAGLEQQVRQASEACDQLQALCQRGRETHEQYLKEHAQYVKEHEEYLKEQETRQRKQQKRQKEQELERRQEKKQVLGRLKLLVQELDASEATAREVFRLYDKLRRSESKARSQALRWRMQEERTRGHLSYRIGSVLVANSPPVKWVKIPGALGREYRDFRRKRQQGDEEPAPEVRDTLGETSGAFMPVRKHWSELRIQKPAYHDVWARALTVRPECKVTIEVVARPSRLLPGQGVGDQGGPSPHTGGEAPLKVELRSGVVQKLLRFEATDGEMMLSMRKLKGVPTILHLELRQKDSTPEPRSDDVVSRLPRRAGKVSGGSMRASSGAGSGLVGERAERATTRIAPGPIVHALELIQAGDFKRGIKYALAHASDVERPTIELLHANHVLADAQAWLRHLNAYVHQFRIAPIELGAEGASRYLRLRARPSRTVDSGPVVSVIMPAFNAARTLEFAARSILNQTWRPLELIVVDDASQDATWSIACGLAHEDSRVRVFQNATNVGPYVSKDLGVLVARGDYVTGHDADDWAHPERIENHVEAMLRDRAKASLIKMLRLSDAGEFSRIGKNTVNRDDGVLQTAFISCMLEVKFLRERLGSWDSVRFGADSELISRARRVLGGQLPVYRQLGLLCLDSQQGLTADPVNGVSRKESLSPSRLQYKQTFTEWHRTLALHEACLPFPHRPRRFVAPASALVPDDAVAGLKARMLKGGDAAPVARAQPITVVEHSVDVCIITNLAFPGGNASSTLDEVRACMDAGLTVKLLHCPVERGTSKDISERYDEYLYLCEDCRYQRRDFRCDVMIVRHPAVICASLFPRVAESVRAQAAVVVINNSMFRIDGTRVYSEDELCQHVSALRADRKIVFPLGPAIRRELLGSSLAGRLDIAPANWSPTFSVDALRRRAVRPIGRPIVIGRHSRDGQEKWLEDPVQLATVYPHCEEIRVKILGGAKCAERILGERPRHWEVHPFGSLSASEFLDQLDVFVYFPNSELNEAFGRTVMEAIFVGVPCIVPARFNETFGRLAFCCEPDQAIPAARRLSQSFSWCSAFVERARDLAIPQYGSEAVLRRLSNVSEVIAGRIALPVLERSATPDLDKAFEAYARWICTGEGAPETYTDGRHCASSPRVDPAHESAATS